MQHLQISCDSCAKKLAPTDVRYELRMEAKLVTHPADTDDTALEHEPIDPLDAMEDLLAAAEDTCDDSDGLAPPVLPLDCAYDLCPVCYARIQADPLGLDRVRRFQFSDN